MLQCQNEKFILLKKDLIVEQEAKQTIVPLVWARNYYKKLLHTNITNTLMSQWKLEPVPSSIFFIKFCTNLKLATALVNLKSRERLYFF